MATRFTVTAPDGTAVAAWRNDATGPPVVISNGLGTPPEAWPELGRADCGLAVATWYYRGTGGGTRPADPNRIRIEDHVSDLIALMDGEGMERAVLACWSLGVNVGFEAALLHPDRIAGLLAVAGVPGGTFAAMGGPLRVPRVLRHQLAVGMSRALRAAAPLVHAVVTAVPLTPTTCRVMTHSGLLRPPAGPEVLIPALSEFRKHDFRWYFTLALAAADHPPMDLRFVGVPTTFVAGRHDMLTSAEDILEAAGQIPHAEVEVLPGSHFLPLEYPRELTVLLRELVARTDLP
ncbi:MAG: alpha/beta fold hydrolase [Mycobacteriales bacterium]